MPRSSPTSVAPIIFLVVSIAYPFRLPLIVSSLALYIHILLKTRYADYAYYTGEFYGTAVAESDFPRLSVLASGYLDYITMGKAKCHSDLDAVKMACCALAEQYQRIELAEALSRKALTAAEENAESGELQSQSVGGWSKSYRSGGESAASAASVVEQETSLLYTTAKQYLAYTGLLYRGGGCKCSCSPIL